MFLRHEAPAPPAHAGRGWRSCGWWPGLLLGAGLATGVHGAADFTLGIEAGSPETLPLVRHDEPWRFFEGRTEPPGDWATRPDAELPAGWQEAPGGFGYGDPGFPGENTPLPGMRGNFTSLYVRREFVAADPPAGDWRLQLTVDFDDGFVAYLDGVEVARQNVEGAPGQPVPFNGTAAGSREGSCCDDPTSPPTVIDLGPAADLLSPGRHVLALHGLNRDAGSSDFHLVADLALVRQPAVLAGRYFALSRREEVTLTGANGVEGVTRLRLNGLPFEVADPAGPWTAAIRLAPGWNRWLLEGLDDQGNVLATAGLDVIRQDPASEAPVRLDGEVVWDADGGVVLVPRTVTLTPGTHLTLAAGLTVLFGPDAGLDAAEATVEVAGTAEQPVFLGPADGASSWPGIAVSGAQGRLIVRHAEIVGGRLDVADGASGRIEDSVIRDRDTGDAIVHSDHAAEVTLRRCRLARFHETLFQYSLTTIEDCLLEDFPGASSDGIDFDGGLPGSVIRRCTIRGGLQDNSDAIDIGSGSNGILIEGCWLHHFSDKGVSIGEDAHGIVVTNCLIHHTGIGVEVKDGCTAAVVQSTIADCEAGFRLRIKFGPEGGHLTNSFNNILWGNGETLVLQDDSTIVAHHSLMAGLPVAGEGNLDQDPGFRDPAVFDYRLPADSPLRSAGLDGAGLGARLPVGAVLLATQPRLALAVGETGPALQFPADPQARYRIETAATPEGPWTDATLWTPPPWPDTGRVRVAPGETRFYRLVRLPATP